MGNPSGHQDNGKGECIMDKRLNEVLDRIESRYSGEMQPGARHYTEVSLAEVARSLGYADLVERYRTASAIIPLKQPQHGMKVRIDGRTFVNYAEYASGMAVPAYLAHAAGRKYRTFVPRDSMVCNFC
jgi:hypothetical protein